MTETNKRTRIQKRTSRLREVECPKCKARFLFRRAQVPHFDSHGFESYELDCSHCGASLTGIIDPFDGALLLSAT
jgi:C4-type Zn-finger protein